MIKNDYVLLAKIKVRIQKKKNGMNNTFAVKIFVPGARRTFGNFR